MRKTIKKRDDLQKFKQLGMIAIAAVIARLIIYFLPFELSSLNISFLGYSVDYSTYIILAKEFLWLPMIFYLIAYLLYKFEAFIDRLEI